MTDRHDKDILDRVADEIRAQQIDDATAQRITDEVRERLGIGRRTLRPLASCDDFQAEIPAYVAGTLPEARALLVGDHTRECLPCRRVLMEARGVTTPASPRPSASTRSRSLSIGLRVAAAALLFAGGVAGYRTAGNVIADRTLRARVETVDGTLQRVEKSAVRALDTGAEVRSRQVLRTTKGSGAVVLLADGSSIEMNERSELELRASRRGTTIDLARGNIIVNAADQGSRRLVVDTTDCQVAVKGTIFAVNHGLKGSRVSVIEGAVEVREGSSRALLRPGDQITTGDRLRRVPLEDEISWSRNAANHKALLRELTDLRRVIADAVDHAPPRNSTFLLDLAPADTLLYAAMPNISGDLEEARSLFYERLASSEVLAEWWQEQVAAHGIDREIDQLLDRLQPLGEAIGAEAVVAVPSALLNDQGFPLFMAELIDPSGFGDLLEQVVEEANAEITDRTVAVIVDDPATADPGAADLYLWVEGELFAAAGDIGALRELAMRIDDPDVRLFQTTALRAQLAEFYSGGVSWLLGADLASIIAEGTRQASPDEIATLERLGLLDADTLVIERHRDGDWYATNAELLFSEPRHGMTAWLADPAPMGSLEFVSPDAYVVGAAVTKDALEMFDDLLDLIAMEDPGALDELHLVQERIGLDLRSDLAATFGGEAAFALDGPMLPVPSWKIIVEVYDPGTLLHTIERAVNLVNLQLAAQGEAGLVFESSDGPGRTFYTVRRDGADGSVVFTIIDGYLVAAPSRALVEQAIAQRASGVNITTSNPFRTLLPDNGFTDCSALVYRDLGSLLDAVPAEVIGELEFADALSDGLEQGLVCVFGGRDRITASATGGSLIGLASTLGLCGSEYAEKRLTEETRETEAVSSL